jgi:hypothetical protein
MIIPILCKVDIMRPLLLIIIIILLTAKFVSGQATQLTINQIDSIVYSIDSTRNLRNAIVDGTLRPKGKRKPVGGFSDTYLIASTENRLLKVQHGASLFYLDLTTYYFFKDSLIFVKTVRHNIKDTTANTISSGQYYFSNGSLITRQEQGQPLTRPEVFLKDARRYLTDVKGIFNL